MKNYLIVLLSFSLILMTACNSSTQYDVIIQNKTNHSLTVVSKTNTTIEQSTEIPAGKNQLIISSPNIPNETIQKTEQPCNLVAEYVQIFDNNGNPSTIKWCDQIITATTVDLGQTEYVITVKEESFNQ